jgi:hypothetical protein
MRWVKVSSNRDTLPKEGELVLVDCEDFFCVARFSIKRCTRIWLKQERKGNIGIRIPSTKVKYWIRVPNME